VNTAPLYLAEIVAYDPALGTTRTIRVANRAFRTKPGETPANTPYEVCLQQPTDIGRSLFAPVATRGRSTMSIGDITLLNPDGELDYLSDLAFDTRTVTVRRATKLNPSYPADFTSFVATMEQPEWDAGKITLKLRDVFYNVANAPLQTNKYLGNNALPAGLEGTVELAGKSKPVCLGVARMVPAPCVNTSKLIYQVNDGAVNSIDGARDRGVALQQGHQWNSAGVVGSGSAQSLWYGGGLWVRTDFSNGTVHTSPDAVAWTLKYTVTGVAPRVLFAAYHAGEWLLSASNSAGQLFLHTTNSFTTVTTSAQPTSVTGAVFYHESASLWITLASGNIYSSPDALTWTLRHTSGGPIYTYGAYLNGIAAAIGIDPTSGQGVVVSSTDGISWFDRVSGITAPSGGGNVLTRMTTGPDRFVAIGDAGSSVVSLDGIAWTRGVMGANAPNNVQIVYAGGLYMAPSNSNGFLVSEDGLEWATYGDGLSTTFIRGIASDGTNLITSDNASTMRYTTPASYATLADLLDDTLAPLPFHWKAYLAGGYVRLGGTPDGQPLFDVTQGATTASRAAAGLAAVVLARVPGAPTFNSGDLATLAGLTSAPLDVWDFDSGATCDAVLDQIAGSVGTAWYPDKSGAFRIAQFTAPSGTPALTIKKSDIKVGTLQRIASNDQGNGIPLYQVVMQYARYYQTVTTDIAGAVSDADRADFAQEWRNAPSTDLSVLTAHPSASVLTIQSLFAASSDAQTEADRQLALRKVKRDPYELTIELNDETDALDLNSVIEIVHPRYSLSVVGSVSESLTGIGSEGGGLFRILDARPNAEAKELTLTVWGGARYKNLVDANGAYVTDSNGAFVVAGIAA
jgi:hypothetical protein